MTRFGDFTIIPVTATADVRVPDEVRRAVTEAVRDRKHAVIVDGDTMFVSEPVYDKLTDSRLACVRQP